LKNTGVRTRSSRKETSIERVLREQLAAEQETSARLIENGSTEEEDRKD